MAREKKRRCPTCGQKVKLLDWDGDWYYPSHYKDGVECPKSLLRS